MGGHSPFEIQLSDEQRATLQETARTYTARYSDVVRAKIVLWAAEGVTNSEIAVRLDTSPQVVSRWRKRFFEEGMDGLRDRPRSGHPPSFSPRSRCGGESARV